jgi:hypothetical protein
MELRLVPVAERRKHKDLRPLPGTEVSDTLLSERITSPLSGLSGRIKRVGGR